MSSFREWFAKFSGNTHKKQLKATNWYKTNGQVFKFACIGVSKKPKFALSFHIHIDALNLAYYWEVVSSGQRSTSTLLPWLSQMKMQPLPRFKVCMQKCPSLIISIDAKSGSLLSRVSYPPYKQFGPLYPRPCLYRGLSISFCVFM